MRNISFAWTTPALLAGHKTVTRRDWQDRYARSFRAGELVAAYDRQPRFRGQKVATIRLTQAPYQERTCDTPEADYDREGFAYLTSIGKKVNGYTPHELWRAWRGEPDVMWVVRFELVDLTPYGQELLAKVKGSQEGALL